MENTKPFPETLQESNIPKSYLDPVNDPETYKHSNVNETKNHNIEDIYASWDNLIAPEQMEVFESMVLALIECNPKCTQELEKCLITLRRKYKFCPKKSQLIHMYRLLVQRGLAPSPEDAVDPSGAVFMLPKLLVKKAQKSQSGVLVVTVVTSPYPTFGGKKQRFSCQWNCYYCPNEPDQPRSYLHDEPSVLRANRNDFDAVKQFCDRAVTLAINGHPVDKIELLILGGTWASYPVEYQETFIRDLFFAANTFYDREKRERNSLDQEKLENETAIVKIIGITLETRPDCINEEELIRFRRFGCTRVQLGLQHTDNGILKLINRGATTEDSIRAIKLLRDTGYKMDIHLMPNLPGSTPEMDLAMFDYILSSPDLQADQWKIYPCEVLPWTVLKKWYDEGTFVPYPDEQLIEVLLKVKAKVHPWIRLNRVIRDIPSQYILGGLCAPNLRQELIARLKEKGTPCKCIRCREVKTDGGAASRAILTIRKYTASHGLEYFISYETPDEATICGFARLRISDNAGGGIFPELVGSALIRELHVYGQLVPTTSQEAVNYQQSAVSQHSGFGRKLMAHAELLARQHGKKKVAVISGVGVRNFYRKLGYELHPGKSEMMIKELEFAWYEELLFPVRSTLTNMASTTATFLVQHSTLATTAALSVSACVIAMIMKRSSN